MKPIATSKLRTTNIIMLIVSALTLALGVALLANYLTSILGTTFVLFIVSIILIIISLFIALKLANPKVKLILRIRGGFSFDVNNLNGKEIIGYSFNRDMVKYLKAIAKENKAYHAIFKDNHKSEFTKPYNPEALNFYNLSASCAEFLFLYKLSLHLNAYFRNNEIDKSLISPIPRTELSQDLLKNRILELITRNHQEREAFSSHKVGINSRLCYATGSNGEVYNSIELELPKHTTIKRLNNNQIIIKNDVFEIMFKVRCDGINTVVASELMIGKYEALTLVAVELTTTIKKNFFLSESDSLLYQWLDSFLIEFEEYMSIKKLEERSYLQLIKILKSDSTI